jgi:hypothetical protein
VKLNDPLVEDIFSYTTRGQKLGFEPTRKLPGFNDRKRVHISNIESFAIVESRELSCGLKSKFLAARGIGTMILSFDRKIMRITLLSQETIHKIT